MKKGLWIAGLVLAVLRPVSPLCAADVQWQAVGDPPSRETPAATLDAPVAIQASLLAPPRPLPPATPTPTPAPAPAPVPAPIQPVSYETAIPVVAPPSPKPTSDVIAISSPLGPPAPLPPEEQEEVGETVFAAERPQRRAASPRAATGDILQTSATVAVPQAPAAPDVPMVPGWEAPVDASWGVNVPKGPLPEGDGPPPLPSYNPLRPRFYASAQYLLWWIQGQTVPVLATTGDQGILGNPGTQVLFGGNQINGNSPFSGAMFTAGYWLGCDQNKAIEITGFFLGTRSENFTTNSLQNGVIGRPFFEVNNGQENAQLTSSPGVASGTLTVNSPTSLWGIGGNYRCLLCCGCNYVVSALIGFRNVNLDESITITENVQGLSTAPPPFTNEMITVQDSFATQNHFYGANVGANARYYWGRWSVDVLAQVALGDNAQQLDINGSQRFVSPTGTVQNFTGGLLALPSNIGHFHNNAFSVVPWLGVNAGYQILPHLRGFLGYNFLYWSNVIRPGTSIDRNLDVTQIPNFPLNPEPAPAPGQNPAPTFHEVGFWAQGISFGLEFLY